MFALILLNSRECSRQLDQQASGKANNIDFSTEVLLSSEGETAVGSWCIRGFGDRQM